MAKKKRKTTKRRAGANGDADRARRRGYYRRNKAGEYSRRDSTSIREIGPIPNVKQPRRRAAALRSTERFALTYFGERFPLKFSADHRKALKRCDAAIDDDALFAWGMPRGSGKTTIAEVAAIRALCSGRHLFVALIGSDKESAVDMLQSIKIEFEINELLAADFPEICYPIAALDGINHRCAGQTVDGVRTRIEWGADRIVLPTIVDSPAAGAVVRCYGITGKIRGAKFRRPNGDTIRPSFVVGDDLQTDESAWSDSQCAHRERVLKGAILGLAGPGKRIAGIFPMTVIRDGDLADRILDPRQTPEFHGERFALLYSFPTHLEAWETYNERRVADLESGDDRIESATAYYKRHRRKLDRGARVAWPQRFDAAAGEVSAIQHAMNLYYRDPFAFAAEYQNKPARDDQTDDVFLNAAAIAARVNEFDRGVVPQWATKLVAHIDVQGSLLYWVVCAFSDAFTGAVVAYGAWPRQSRRYFTLASANPTFAQACKATTVEGRIREALIGLVEHDLAVRDWRRQDGAALRLSILLIDAQYETDSVYSFIQSSAFPSVWPAHGFGIGASGSPISDDRKKPGEVIGLNWKIPAHLRRGIRRIVFDANFWKTFAQRRLATPTGDPGSLSLHSAAPAAHRMIADHLVAEVPHQTTGRGRTLFEWKLRPNKPDNHFADGVVGCCVAASVAGCRLPGAAPTTRRRRRRRNVSYM